jgi:hypothetical protein
MQAKEEALATLRQVLHISNDDHLRVRQDVRAEQQGQRGQASQQQQQQQAQGQGKRCAGAGVRRFGGLLACLLAVWGRVGDAGVTDRNRRGLAGRRTYSLGGGTFGAARWDVYGAARWGVYGAACWDVYASCPSDLMLAGGSAEAHRQGTRWQRLQ